MTTTTPPPPKTSSRPFIIAILLLLLLVGALVFWKLHGDDEGTRAVASADAPPATVAIPDQVLPPPPPLTSADAGSAPEPTKKATVSSTFCSSCAACTGTEAPNFQGIARGRGAAAQRCYEKALQQQEQLQGKLMVNLCVGVGGGVCSATITSDTLGSPLVSQCVLNLFRATPFPSPKNGCVQAQVPLNFVPKKQ